MLYRLVGLNEGSDSHSHLGRDRIVSRVVEREEKGQGAEQKRHCPL
jgi:hypothetical protein